MIEYINNVNFFELLVMLFCFPPIILILLIARKVLQVKDSTHASFDVKGLGISVSIRTGDAKLAKSSQAHE